MYINKTKHQPKKKTNIETSPKNENYTTEMTSEQRGIENLEKSYYQIFKTNQITQKQGKLNISQKLNQISIKSQRQN